MDTIDSSKVLSDCATTISMSKDSSPWIVVKAKSSDDTGTFTKSISVKLCDDELHSIHDWIEDYFKTKDKELQKQKERNRKVFEDCLLYIKTDERETSRSIVDFIEGISKYFDFTYAPRAEATLRNSVQVFWKENDFMLIFEFLFVSMIDNPLIIWDIKDKDGQYCGEGRIDINGVYSTYASEINKMVETFYHPSTAEA